MTSVSDKAKERLVMAACVLSAVLILVYMSLFAAISVAETPPRHNWYIHFEFAGDTDTHVGRIENGSRVYLVSYTPRYANRSVSGGYVGMDGSINYGFGSTRVRDGYNRTNRIMGRLRYVNECYSEFKVISAYTHRRLERGGLRLESWNERDRLHVGSHVNIVMGHTIVPVVVTHMEIVPLDS